MKKFNCTKFILFLIVHLLAIHADAASLKQQLPAHPSEQLVEVKSIKELPEDIIQIVNQKYGKVADIDQKFNTSCIPNFTEPSKGLKQAVFGENSATLIIAIGGFALKYDNLRFFKGKSGWYLEEDKNRYIDDSHL